MLTDLTPFSSISSSKLEPDSYDMIYLLKLRVVRGTRQKETRLIKTQKELECSKMV